MHGLKIDMNFFLKMLNGERLINPKHKTLEDKEVTTDTRGCQIHESRCIEDMKRIISVAATK